MRRTAPLALACLALAFALVPLALTKPGWPTGLKSDEPAYYLMAMSLAWDGDLLLDRGDLRRAFDEFPFGPINNVILATDDGWRTIHFGKPYLYSLFAAPFARLAGASGMVTFNMLLLWGMVALGYRWLRRFNPEGPAALFAAGFFVLSAGFAYVFWIHPEVLNMAAVAACLYLALATPEPGAAARWWRRPLLRAALSGAALAPAVYMKPMLALLGIPALAALWWRRERLGSLAWIGGAVGAMALVVGVSLALTGHASAYLGWARGGYEICSPDHLPVEPAADALPRAQGAGGEGEGATRPQASWSWIFNVPDLRPREVAENLGYFLWGRHAGLLLYFPFSLLAIVLFAVHERRSRVGWALLASLAAVAAVFLLWIPFNWQGGGGFVGNRYYVNAYPAFLFLVTRLSPAWLTFAGYGLGGLLLGPTLLSPLGRSVPWPTLQAHVRNFPYPHFPLELSLKNVPGYHKANLAGVGFMGRRDQFLPHGEGFWVHGAGRAEIWLQSSQPIDSLVLDVASPAAPNTLVFRLPGIEERIEVAPGEEGRWRRLHFEPSRATRVRGVRGSTIWAYRLTVTTETGAVRTWTRAYPPSGCPQYPWVPSLDEAFYTGAEVRVLGSAERLARDVYGVEWLMVRTPREAVAGEPLRVGVRLRNTSATTWPARPPAAVQLAYHWERPGGEVVVREGERTRLPGEVAPGEEVAVRMAVTAPDEPGDWVLALDPVYEGIAWFSERAPEAVRRVPVRVLPPAAIPAGREVAE